MRIGIWTLFVKNSVFFSTDYLKYGGKYMLYQICNGAVRFGGTTVLENINFEIRDTEKIAVVGRNGCGKTTLLKLIAGEVELSKRDSDEDIYIAMAGKPEIGYLKQMAFEDETETLENEVRKAFSKLLAIKEEMNDLVVAMEQHADEKMILRYAQLQEQFEIMDGYTYEKELEVVLKNFGFTEADKRKSISEFSGGQKTKIAFAKMLLGKPDILLLDEPTNHLDMNTISWLEDYLKEYKKAVVIVSHDRMFLDKVVDVVYEIEYKSSKRYPGNYTAFVERKRLNWEKQKKDYELQKKEIERLQTIVDKFKNKPTKVAMTRSKLKQIEHMDKIDAPARYDRKTFHAGFVPERESVKDVLSVERLQVGYDSVLSEISLQQKKGQKIGIIGDNGVGKSTFLRTLVGQIEPLDGTFSFGMQTDVGYFEQQMAEYNSDKTVLEDFWDEFPNEKQQEIRSALGAFLFSGDEVYKKIDMLSGGEKVRLALAKIFMRKPNFLILDEPTNHMDIIGKESLEQMLKAYTGTVLFVSHDRYFVKEVADALLVFSEGRVAYYPYGYGQYQEACLGVRVTRLENRIKLVDEGTQKESTNNPGKEEARMRKRVERLEALIDEQEVLLAEIQKQILDSGIQTDYVKLTQLHDEQSKENEKLHMFMEEWEKLNNCLDEK